MPRYRVTAVNGRAWITDHFEDISDAKNIVGGVTGRNYVEFAGVPFEDDRPGELQVILSARQVVSFEEWPS